MPDYKVRVQGQAPIMVRAANQAQARNYAVKETVTVELLTVDDAIAMAKDGEELHVAAGSDDDAPEQARASDAESKAAEKKPLHPVEPMKPVEPNTV